MRINLLHSARARFAATAAVVFALVAIGGVTAAPASAAPVTVTITVRDIAQGGLLPNRALTLESSDGVTSYNYTTSSSAELTVSVEEGSYRLVPGGQYAPSEYFTLSAGQPTISVDITKPTVYGSVPAAAGGGHTAIGIEIWYHFEGSSNYFWSEINGSSVGNADGTFGIVLQTGTGKYRLHFKPDGTVPYLDSYSPEFTADGSVAAINLGAVALTPAGSISGTVTSSSGGGAIGGATVTATSGASTTTKADGSYFMKVAASAATVTVSATAPGFTGASAAPVTLNAGNAYSAAAVNLALVRQPINLTGSTVGGNVVDTFLYKKDSSGKYAQTPYRSTLGSASFSYSDLPDGDYRIAFRSPTTQRTLVWSSLTDTGSTIGSPDTYGSCYYGFTMSPASGSRSIAIGLADEQVVPATCTTPAYADSADATVTGTVLNKALFPYLSYAKLYKTGASGATVVDTSQINQDGTYSLSGVREAGDYYIKFEPNQEYDSYLTTLLGDGGETAWAKDSQTESDFAADHSFAVDPATSTGLSGHDVTIEMGARLTGWVVALTGPIGATVTLADADDPTDTIAVPMNAYSGFAIVVPAGGSYTLLAESIDGAYASEYWSNVSSLGEATVIGPLVAGSSGEYGFTLEPSPPVLFGYITDVAQTWPITVHLYKKDAYGLWQPAGELDSVSEAVKFSGLTPGDYRMRFERGGDWMSANSYRIGTLPNRNTSLTSVPSCFVDFTGVTTGMPSFIEATFDSDVSGLACAAEPPTQGDVVGQLVSSPATGSVEIEGAAVYVTNSATYMSYPAVSDANGNFTIPNVPNGHYYLSVDSAGPHVSGASEYFFEDEFDFAGGADVGTIRPTRIGNVSGEISNWDDATMSGARATLYTIDPSTSLWEPTYFSTNIVDGYFELPAIRASGQYSVHITFDDTYVDTFIGGGTLEPTAPFTGTLEQDYAYPAFDLDLIELVTISGTVFYGSFALEGGDIYAEGSDGNYYYGSVQEDGSYAVAVPPNDDYLVSAEYDPLMLQYYDGVNYEEDDQGPYTGTPVAVDSTEVTDIDFSLIASQNDNFYLYTLFNGGGANPYGLAGVTVHLYQHAVDGWVEVDSETSTPSTYLDSTGGGDYRLRFEKDGDWLRIDQVSWLNQLPPFDETDGTVPVGSCYLEFTDLHHGSQLEIEPILDVDGAATSGCGPEVVAERYDVIGSTVQSANFGSGPVVGQTVTLTSGTGVVLSQTTDQTGVYFFEGVTPGTYTLDVPTMVLASNGHAYVSHSQTVVVDGDEALDPLELTRYGNAELGIYNWDPSLAGAVAHLEIEQSPGVWVPTGIGDVVDNGQFVIPGIAVDGDYRIWVDYPAGFVDGYAQDYYVPSNLALLSGDAEFDNGGTAIRAYTTVTGVVSLGATAVTGATVRLESWSGGFSFTALTDSTGGYSIAVPAGGNYAVYAEKTGLVRGLLTAETVGYAPRSNVNLAMKFATFHINTFADTDPLTVHLYKKVTGGWQEVESDTYSEVELWSTLSGDYRLRFSDGAEWLAISEYEIDGASAINPVPNVCFIDIAPAVGGSEYKLKVEPVTPPAGVSCGAEPAVVAPPVTPGTTGTGSTGSGTKKPVTFTTTPVAAEAAEVAPTSTPTPTPEPSESATAEPNDGAAVENAPAASAPDLTWVFVVAGILVLLVLAGGAVYLVRRRP